MSDPFDPDVYASEADYRAGKRRPNGADHADTPHEEDNRAKGRESAADDDPGRGSDRASTSLRPLSVAELLRRETPKWLVRGLLPARGFIVIFGASYSGKTFLALDVATTLSRNDRRWFGRRVRGGGVVYVASEGQLQVRVRAYLAHHGLDAEALPRLRIIPATVNLLRPEMGDLETLIAEIKGVARELGGVVLIVLDTLNSMMPGGNENTSEDMGLMIAAARRIMATVDCAVAYVHHSGKDESKGSRGHSSLKAATDAEIEVTGVAGDRVMEAIKVRDGESGQRFGFRLQAVDLGPDPDPDADPDERITSCVVQPLDQPPAGTKPKVRREIALDALRETISEYGKRMPGTSTIPAGINAVTLDQWKSRWALRTGYDDSTGNAIAVNFHKDKDALLKSGAIVISKPYVWVSK